MKKNNNKGFTLMEMLIVVAIIAILVAIAIPTFTGSLDKARKAADEANVRAAYSEAMSKYLLGDYTDTTNKKVVVCTNNKMQAANDAITIGDQAVAANKWAADKYVTVTVTAGTATAGDTSGDSNGVSVEFAAVDAKPAG